VYLRSVYIDMICPLIRSAVTQNLPVLPFYSVTVTVTVAYTDCAYVHAEMTRPVGLGGLVKYHTKTLYLQIDDHPSQ